MTSNALLGGLAFLLFIQFISTWFVGSLSIAFPPALLGMILLTVLLLTKTVRLSWIEAICTLLLEKMGMLFVPAGVSILLYAEIIAKESLAIFATIIVSSIVVIVVTGLSVDFMLKRNEAGKK